MGRPPRNRIVDKHKVQCFHVISECVRQAYLCGEDRWTGKNYDHRRKWIEQRTIDQAKYFAIEVVSMAIMSNHCHHVLRTRPDLVKKMSKREIAERWLGICPKRRDENGNAAKPTDKEVDELMRNRKKMTQIKERLSSISWFNRIFKQRIGKQANIEDDTRGRFWAGRFKGVLLESEEAILACSVYVDLNPIRAGMATVPEESYFTSLYHRLVAHRSRARRGHGRDGKLPWDPHADSWLAPFFTRKLPKKLKRADAGSRASDDAGLAIEIEQYFQLVDWTGRQFRSDKRGAIPADVAPLLDRLSINSNSWPDLVRTFGSWSKRVVANVETMEEKAAELGQAVLHGIGTCRELFLS